MSAIAFPHDVSLLLIQSGVPHALVGGEYNVRRGQCQEAAEGMGVPFLRDATAEMLAATNLPEIVRRRAFHIIGENDRVLRTRELLLSGDVAAVGHLMTASHESSRLNFENSTPALDLLAEYERLGGQRATVLECDLADGALRLNGIAA